MPRAVTVGGDVPVSPTRVSYPCLLPGPRRSGRAVWVFGLASGSLARSVVYRYDGSHWHKIPVPAETAFQGAVALGPDNVWAFGTSATVFAPGSHVSADLFHWNGSKWRATAPITAN
jgi:hypothetical protein